MKNNSKRSHSIVFIVVMAATIIIILHLAIDKVSDSYKDRLYLSAMELRKDFIGHTVKNLVTDIEAEKDEQIDEYRTRMKNAVLQVDMVISRAGSGPEEAVKEYFDSRVDSASWTCLAYDNSNNEILMDPSGILGDFWDGNIEPIRGAFCMSETITSGNTVILYGVTNTTLKKIVQECVARKVRYNQFEEGTRMWITEIRRYGGGKDYARCLVNPLNESEEGRLLSTETTDAEGVKYLEKELEYLKEGGTALYSYKLKNKESNYLEERIVYSELVSDYDWVLSMESDMNDVVNLVDSAQSETSGFIISFEAMVIVGALVIILAMSYMTVRSEREATKGRRRELEKKIQHDALTGATSRQYGEEQLKQFFEEYKRGKPSPVIMILDVDHFKTINDTYGHDMGDIILKRTVTSLKHTIRNNDYIVRWGGDEFVGIYLGLDHENIVKVAEKVTEAVREVKVNTSDGKELSVTASVGFAEFAPDDKNYTDGLKRADNMLYDSKIGGRNQYHIAGLNARIDANKKSDRISRE